jgi:hypothetical protein
MATKINVIATQRGTTPTLGRTIQGNILRATSVNESERAATKGRTTAAFKTAKSTS